MRDKYCSFDEACLDAPEWATHAEIGRDIEWLQYLGTSGNGAPVFRDCQGFLVSTHWATPVSRELPDDPGTGDPNLA